MLIEKRDGNCHVFADGRCEMLLKAIGQMLGIAKGYGKATRKCPKSIEEPLGNS
jgi:hypothetical protein